jgi:hypothetical protein
MTQQTTHPSPLELLRRLVGEWSVGVAMITSGGQTAQGHGEMTAVEVVEGVNSEFNMHLEGYDDYYENDLWSFDGQTRKVHMFGLTSEGEAHDHVGEWEDEKTLRLSWRGNFADKQLDEQITLRWISGDEFEIRETALAPGRETLTTEYVFKRKNLNPTVQPKP